MILFGGGNAVSPSNLFNDTWVLTNANGLGGTPSWVPVTANGAPGAPPQRSTPAVVYNSSNHRFTVFGGYNPRPAFNARTRLNDASHLVTAHPLSPPAPLPTPA